jgi:putative endonuclease
VGTRPNDGRGALGAAGESATLEVYRGEGFRLLARNWRCPLGELDLVVQSHDLIVVCEVKTRSDWAFGGGYEAVTHTKRAKLRRLAEAFLANTGSHPDRVRFDVASVFLRRGEVADVELFHDAF